MSVDSIEVKLVRALDTLTNDELDELAAALSSPASGQAISYLVIGLRQARFSRMSSMPTQKMPDGGKKKPNSSLSRSVSLRDAFFKFIEDKSQFPTVASAAEALRHVFGWTNLYSSEEKISRRRFASRAWSRFESLPESEQRSKLRSVIGSTGQNGSTSQYVELFNALTQ